MSGDGDVVAAGRVDPESVTGIAVRVVVGGAGCADSECHAFSSGSGPAHSLSWCSTKWVGRTWNKDW